MTTTSVPEAAAPFTPIESEGQVRIELLASEPPPGSRFSSCGDHVGGCTGRLRLSFQLLSPRDGSVDSLIVYLHATHQVACLIGDSGRLELTAGRPLDVEVVLDRADPIDRCRTPLTMATMDAVMNAATGIASRQAWSIFYQFDP